MLSKSQVPVFTFDLRKRAGLVAFAVALIMVATASGLPAETLSVLHSFTAHGDGGTPYAGLTPDHAGNFYGTSSYGGAHNYGTVFKMTHSGSGWILSTLYSFQGGSDGGYPYARVVFGPDGALYGTTSGYGLTGSWGTVFRLQPPSRRCASINCPWTETVLYRFPGYGDAAFPGYGDLAFDAAGNIYGTTMSGGAGPDCQYGNCGLVFKLTRSGGSWTESTLYSFTDSGNTGTEPQAGVILDSVGNLYGTTLLGGPYGAGAVFELTQSGSSWTATALHTFGAIGDGAQPFGGLIMDPNGNLYGTTVFGITNESAGTVYELQPSGGSWNYSVLADLPGTGQPLGPSGALARDAAGNLYGTTLRGGGPDYGSIFKLTPSNGAWTYTDLHDFGGRDGTFPYGNVVLDAHGNLYGTTSEGLNSWGVVWELAP